LTNTGECLLSRKKILKPAFWAAPTVLRASTWRRPNAGPKSSRLPPLYEFDAQVVRGRITETYEQVLEQTRRNLDEFVWDTIRSVDELGVVRMEAMQNFLADFEAGRLQGRYIQADLPALPFPDKSFDLAVCSHFLFLYSEQLTAEFHQAAIIELCRVASEVRIFPLLALGGRPSPHISPVTECLRSQGLEVTKERALYEFQRGGNQMMRVRSNRLV
jgi:Methyltransferase domain